MRVDFQGSRVTTTTATTLAFIPTTTHRATTGPSPGFLKSTTRHIVKQKAAANLAIPIEIAVFAAAVAAPPPTLIVQVVVVRETCFCAVLVGVPDCESVRWGCAR